MLLSTLTKPNQTKCKVVDQTKPNVELLLSTLTKPGGLILRHDETRVIVRVHVVGESDRNIGDGGSPGEARQEHKQGRNELDAKCDQC